MKTLELVSRSVLQFLLAACAALLCVRLVTGCTLIRKVIGDRAQVAECLKAAYAEGGAVAVSNRIEKLVADGKVTPAQAARLHILAQKAFDGVIQRLEDSALEAALTPTNAPAIQ